jgi:hypothetical protein
VKVISGACDLLLRLKPKNTSKAKMAIGISNFLTVDIFLFYRFLVKY